MFNLSNLQTKRNELEQALANGKYERTTKEAYKTLACGDCSGSCSGTCNESCSGKCLGCGSK